MVSLWFLIDVVITLNTIATIIIVFREKRDISATWAWLLVLLLLPIAGFLLYLIAGRKLSHRKIFNLKAQERLGIDQIVANQKLQFDDNELLPANQVTNSARELVRLFLETDNAILTKKNAVRIFTDGDKLFDSMFEDIRRAQHHINIEFFTWYNDQIGNELVHLLERKAAAGVQVRIIYDLLGSHGSKQKLFQHLIELGGHAEPFLTPKYFPITLRLNFRNHRKITVIDGNIGYIGGFNVGDQYLGRKMRFGYWRDTHLRVTGDAVLSMQSRFFLDWNATSKKGQVAFDNKYFPRTKSAGQTSMQIVSSGPDDDREKIKQGYVKMIAIATKSVYIETPYFVPDGSVLEALTIAATAGVDVRIIIPDRPDHPFVYRATEYYCRELIQAGGKVYSYGKGFMHSKMVVIDGKIVSIGSANMDIRSFRLNFEANAFLYDREFARATELIFLHDQERSEFLTLDYFTQQSRFIKIKQALSRLLAPIL
ncbi:cardiolipin synthase [Paucilactobacillus kaifaensis]|uniref:cardiolipin synthase n=1 Tax=Paucilactobacillus kaifaensis TaxID=2559921 RepID=UPI0010F54D51|nr:cardiolipin synthase [Paucilactobacillus kaifaensis]